jgi:hypothetical protein
MLALRLPQSASTDHRRAMRSEQLNASANLAIAYEADHEPHRTGFAAVGVVQGPKHPHQANHAAQSRPGPGRVIHGHAGESWHARFVRRVAGCLDELIR